MRGRHHVDDIHNMEGGGGGDGGGGKIITKIIPGEQKLAIFMVKITKIGVGYR